MTLLTTHLKSQSGLLTRKQTADYLGVTSRTLAVWACTKRYNLPFVKIGRLVKYRIADLDAFITRRTVNSTPSDES
jgi:excisionase family DNA binding protein